MLFQRKQESQAGSRLALVVARQRKQLACCDSLWLVLPFVVPPSKKIWTNFSFSFQREILSAIWPCYDLCTNHLRVCDGPAVLPFLTLHLNKQPWTSRVRSSHCGAKIRDCIPSMSALHFLAISNWDCDGNCAHSVPCCTFGNRDCVSCGEVCMCAAESSPPLFCCCCLFLPPRPPRFFTPKRIRCHFN